MIPASKKREGVSQSAEETRSLRRGWFALISSGNDLADSCLDTDLGRSMDWRMNITRCRSTLVTSSLDVKLKDNTSYMHIRLRYDASSNPCET